MSKQPILQGTCFPNCWMSPDGKYTVEKQSGWYVITEITDGGSRVSAEVKSLREARALIGREREEGAKP